MSDGVQTIYRSKCYSVMYYYEKWCAACRTADWIIHVRTHINNDVRTQTVIYGKTPT